MKGLILLSLLLALVSCADGGGGSSLTTGSAPVKAIPINSTNPEEIEEDILIYSKNVQIDTHYNLRTTQTFNTQEGPVNFLLNRHPTGTAIYRFDVTTGKYTKFLTSISSIVRNIRFNFDKDYLITHKPIDIIKLDSFGPDTTIMKRPFSDNSVSLKRSSISNGSLYLLGSNQTVYRQDLGSLDESYILVTGNIIQLFGDGDDLILLKKNNDVFHIVEVKNNIETNLISTQEDEKLTMIKRSERIFVIHTFLKNETRPKTTRTFYEYINGQLTEHTGKLPPPGPRFRHIKLLTDESATGLSNKEVKIEIYDNKNDEVLNTFYLDQLFETPNTFYNIHLVDNELYAMGKSKRYLYKYDIKKFERHLFANNRVIQQIAKNDNGLLLSSGKIAYEYTLNNELDETNMQVPIHKILSHNGQSYIINHKANKEGSMIYNISKQLIYETAVNYRLFKSQNSNDILEAALISTETAPEKILDVEGNLIATIPFAQRGTRALVKVNTNLYLFFHRNALYKFNVSKNTVSQILKVTGKRIHVARLTENNNIMVINEGKLQLYNLDGDFISEIVDLELEQTEKIRNFQIFNRSIYLTNNKLELSIVKLPSTLML